MHPHLSKILFMVNDYAIGDIQGCYDALMRLLDHIQFDSTQDRLWLVGDLVNRGSQSLEVIRFLQQLQPAPIITLGNHDLHLLALMVLDKPQHPKDTLDPILHAVDKEEIIQWLRQHPLLVHDASLNIVMSHAGIPPTWSLSDAKIYAATLESCLRSPQLQLFCQHMFGNESAQPEAQLDEIAKLRAICNGLTRMRFCTQDGQLALDYKGSPQQAPQNLIPWYQYPNRIPIDPDLVFGHWAALEGKTNQVKVHAIDTGCVWGNGLTAMRLQDKQRFFVPAV